MPRIAMLKITGMSPPMQTPLASEPMYSTGNFPMFALHTARKRARNMLMMTARVRLRMRKRVVQSSLSR